MAPLPRQFQPQLATLVKSPPEGEEWLHEIKLDGYRIGCRKDGDTVTLISRNGKDWTASFPEIADAARKLRATQALLDGEVVMLQPNGRTSFQALQNAFSGGSRGGLVYFVFDLLHLDGDEVSRAPLEARKLRLARLVGAPNDKTRIRYSDHVAGSGSSVLAEACRLGLEGIVSKRRDMPYAPGRHGGWLKTKCVARQEFVIGGFTDPEGSRAGIGALLVGVYNTDGRLIFSGKVGTGFTHKGAIDLRSKLNHLEQKTPPFDPPPAGWLGKHAHWIRPELVGEVAYTELTDEGKIRHPSFQGLRADKSPQEIVQEHPRDSLGNATMNAKRSNATTPPRAQKRKMSARSTPVPPPRAPKSPARKSASNRIEVAGVSISHPERAMFPDIGVTKVALARYYESIGDWIVPHVDGRPLTLVRCPAGLPGECFYMKHSKVWSPPALHRVNIREKKKVGEYLIADSIAGIVSLVQMDVLEIHTWNSTIDRVEQPNRIVLDIDPGEAVTFKQVAEAARLVRSMLTTLGLASFLKTTGGRGLHVVVPLTPSADWNECLEFSRTIAEAIERQQPDRYTTAFAKAGRERKLLIDYLRNNRTNTSVAAFSTRAKPSAPVSVPISWDELTARLRPETFTIETVPRRLARLRSDPWKAYWSTKQKITAAAIKAVTQL